MADLNHLLESLDNVSAVSESVAEQVGAISDTFVPVAANVTTQLSHLTEMSEALNLNLVHKFDQLSGVLETTSMNHMEGLRDLVAVLAPDKKDRCDRLPRQGLPADPSLPVWPGTPALGQTAGEDLAPDFNAVSAATPAVMQTVGVKSPFAQAASPETMFASDRALKDDQATAGTVFTPFFAALNAVTRQMDDGLYPTMQKLQPPFADLSPIPTAAVGAATDRGATIPQETASGLMAVLEPLGDLVKGWFGSLDFNAAPRHLSEETTQETGALSAFSAPLRTALGPTGFPDNLHTAFGPEPHALAAPENMRMSGIEQIANEVNEAAGRAVGSPGPEKKNSQAELFEQLMKATGGDNEMATALVNMGKAIDAVTAAVTAVGATATAIYHALPNSPSISTPAISAASYLEMGYDRARHGDGLGARQE